MTKLKLKKPFQNSFHLFFNFFYFPNSKKIMEDHFSTLPKDIYHSGLSERLKFVHRFELMSPMNEIL